MKEFLHRSVSDSIEYVDCEGTKTVVTATRTRTSEGHGGISLYADGRRVLDITSDVHDYQGAARAIAALLIRMADEPCNLPSTTTTKQP